MIIMEKEVNTVGLSREFIIHPGETLAEVIEDRGMSQHDLAVRTGMTEKHISTVIHCQKNISASFAKRLEYALGIESSFWMDLQANYDRELIEFEEINNISQAELDVLKNLREVSDTWKSFGWLEEENSPAAMILDYRMLFGLSNLLDTPKISYVAAYLAQLKNTNIDPYVLYAWQRMCELLTKDTIVAGEVNTDKLKAMIPDIKEVMFLRANQIQKALSGIFSECGIAFRIVPCFTGAPVQGLLKTTEDGTLILCMTLRQKFADFFWFTLFHEIAHILNGDTKREFIDFDSVPGAIETKADRTACDLLINSKDYEIFISKEKYKNQNSIMEFARSQKVRDYIVQGRLMKEEKIPWKARPRYDWI